MHPDDRPKYAAAIFFGVPIIAWLVAVGRTETLSHPKLHALWRLVLATPSKPILAASFAAGLLAAVIAIVLLYMAERSGYAGGPFRRFLRGTRIVSAKSLSRRTVERSIRWGRVGKLSVPAGVQSTQQISVCGIPMPTKIELLHTLFVGSTGSGKSVAIREMVYSALLRGDRVIVADPNGEMLARFFRKGDFILNPYDTRGEGWSFFTEVRNDYDFKRLSLSLVPRGQSKDEEEWRQYARLLLQETARKLALLGTPSVEELFRLTTIAPPGELKAFLEGTAAESLFVGADKALASARFVLSSKLPEHLSMPKGSFSLRSWLEESKGNLFITWREDMAEALRPLISAWVDVLCTSILTLGSTEHRRIWMFLDELASLEKLASLKDAATKGRKSGLRIVAGLQSTAQLDEIYGRDEAQTLRSCFRSLVVLGGAKTDPRTCEDASLSLGEHEVERDTVSRSRSRHGNSSNSQIQRVRERVVLPSEIASLPDLTGYVAFAGDYPVARTSLRVLQFAERVSPFDERAFSHDGLAELLCSATRS